MKALKFKAGQIMPSTEEGSLLGDPFHQRFEYIGETEVDIFASNQHLWCRIDLEDKALPLKLSLKCKRDTYAQDYEKELPVDLRIYFSINTKEPNEKNCDYCVGKEDIELMNRTGKYTVFFGKE